MSPPSAGFGVPPRSPGAKSPASNPPGRCSDAGERGEDRRRARRASRRAQPRPVDARARDAEGRGDTRGLGHRSPGPRARRRRSSHASPRRSGAPLRVRRSRAARWQPRIATCCAMSKLTGPCDCSIRMSCSRSKPNGFGNPGPGGNVAHNGHTTDACSPRGSRAPSLPTRCRSSEDGSSCTP